MTGQLISSLRLAWISYASRGYCTQRKMSHGIFVGDVNEQSERNALKLESRSFPARGPGGHFLLAQLNVPSFLCDIDWFRRHRQVLTQRIRSLSGISIGEHQPFVSVQGTFLLEHSRDGRQRVFTGTVQTAHQNKNLIISDQRVTSFEDLDNLAQRAFDPGFLEANLANSFPDSDWTFAGVISIVFVFNCRAQLASLPGYSKHFFEDLDLS